MSAPLQVLHYHVGEDADLPPGRTAASLDDFPVAAADVATAPDAATAEDALARIFTSNEAAARFYLDQILERDDRPAMRALREIDRPDYVPALVAEGE
jgi:bacillolysin